MKSKLTITLAVLLLAILAMPHTADAQDGYTVGKTRGLNKVIATGNNQAIPAVVLTSRGTAVEPPITRTSGTDLTLTVTFGDLPIVQATAWMVDTNGDAEQIEATKEFDDTVAGDDVQFKMGDEELQIFVQGGGTGDGIDANTMIKLADLRIDATSLDDGDRVPITVTASDQEDTIGLGGGGSGSVSASLTSAADGLGVKAVKGNGLTCGTITGVSVTVAEGFARAWNPTLMGPDEGGGDDHTTTEDGVAGSVQIRLDVLNFPDNEGAKIEWPDSVKDNRKDEDPDTAVAETDTAIATLTRDKDGSDASGKYAIYTYADTDSVATDDNETPDDATDDTGTGLQRYLNDAARSFKIDGLKFTNFGGAGINVTARLWPKSKRNSDGKKNAADVKSTLSFEHAAQDPEFDDEERAGDWLIVADCITYLLYPFVTCGDTQEWSTGLSVSNTSKDDGVFGAFDETNEQSGSVILYGFPGGGEASVSEMLTSNLAAGDTITRACDKTRMAGMQGYLIIKANFQHARGAAFVMGHFSGGATVDVTHGYLAEVIDDPADRSEKLD